MPIIATPRFATLLLLCIAGLLVLPEAHAQKPDIGSLYVQSGLHGTTLPTNIPSRVAGGDVDEVEPNNTVDTAQPLDETSPLTVNGNAEVGDEGNLIITFDGGTVDDIEDLFIVEIAETGLEIQLDGLSADCDLYLLDESAGSVLDASLTAGTAAEAIDASTLEAGTYLIGVAIFDPDPGAADETSYALTVTGAIAVAVADDDGVPGAFTLAPNYPNPFNPMTHIQYDLPTQAEVLLAVYDALGRKVQTLVDTGQASGTYTIVWDGRDDTGLAMPSGVYVYRLRAGSVTQSRTMVLAR